MVSGESLSSSDGGSCNGPQSHFRLCVIGTGSLNEVRPITTLDKIESVLEGVVDRTEVIEVTKDSASIGGNIEMVEGIPIVLASKHSFTHRHVEILLGPESVTSVSLPRFGSSHSLTTIGQGMSICRHSHENGKRLTHP